MSENLIIVIPVYNEQDNIEKVLSDWYKIVDLYGDNSKLLVINDGSKDKTESIIQSFKTNNPKTELISQLNSGHGVALLNGYKYALKNDFDYIFQTDSDNQTSTEDFSKFWDEKDNYDLLIGNRVSRKDGLLRHIVTSTLRYTLFFVLGVWTVDANTPYRLIKKNCLTRIIEILPNDCVTPNALMSGLVQKLGFKTKYINITFENRTMGKCSINLIKIVQIGIRVLKELISLRVAKLG